MKVSPEDAAMSYGVVGTTGAGWFSGRPHFQLLEAQEGVTFKYEPNKQ